MKALVTGGGGYLGGCIATALLKRGDEVRIFGRGTYPHHTRVGIETIRGDLRDAQAVQSACRGVDVVYHAGAKVGVWGRRRDFYEVNVDGTRHVIDACRDRGVPKLIFTSSPSVVMGIEDLCGVNESHPYPPRYFGAYSETKALAEQAVLVANSADLATVVIRPHLIWGPGDPHLIPRAVDRARRGKMMRVGDGKNLVDITYIDNAVDAHLLAADVLSPTARCAGRAYFISQGEPVLIWNWLNDVLVALGAPAISRSISFRTAYRIGAILETVYRAARVTREPIMTRFVAVQFAKSHYFDIQAARRDFAFEPRVSTAEGFERLIAAERRAMATTD